jgi:dTDP-D-glucose 4,6-dehydratase
MESYAWDTSIWVGCPDAIQRDLHWRASTDLASGLDQTAKWFRDHPQLLKKHYSR